MAAAVSSLSRTATRRRATPLSRQMRTMKTESRRTPSENQAKDCCEARLMPNRRGAVDERVGRVGQAGAERLVDAGHGEAGRGQHRALHEDGEGERRHGEEEAGHAQGRQPDDDRHQRRHRAAVEHDDGQRQGRAQVHRHQRAHGDEAELPERDLARPPREHGEAQGDDRVDADLAEEHVVADGEHEGQQDGDPDGEPDPGDRDPPAQLVDAGPHGGRRRRAARCSAPPSSPPCARRRPGPGGRP